MKIKELTFSFENCDQITIDGLHIGDFLMDNIYDSIQRVAINSIIPMTICQTFFIEIFKEANKFHYQLGFEEESCKVQIFDRIASGYDITEVDVVLESADGTIQKTNVFVQWKDYGKEVYYRNAYQNYYISKPGNLYLVVSDCKSVKDYVDYEDVNDEESIKFRKEMYSK